MKFWRHTMQTKFSSIFSIMQTSSYSDPTGRKRFPFQQAHAHTAVVCWSHRPHHARARPVKVTHIDLHNACCVNRWPCGQRWTCCAAQHPFIFFLFWLTRKQKSFPSLVDCLRHVASKPLGPGAQYVANSQTVIMECFVLPSAVQSFPFN